MPNKLKDKECNSCDEYSGIGKRILIIKLGALGDVIRTTPLLVRLRKEYPDSHITWITQYPEILPESKVDKVMTLNYNTVLFVNNSIFDIAINLDKDPEACFLLKSSNAGRKFGFSWSEDNHIIGLSEEANRKILTGLFDRLSKSNTKSYQDEIFEICGFEFEKEPILLDVDKTYSSKWNLLKNEAGGKPIVGLNTGCGKRWLTRKWPKEYWEELIVVLQKSDYFPVLLGGEEEHGMNAEYSKYTGAYYPGYYSLMEFIVIVNSCDIVITAVSMAMHVAIALGKPLVLFNNIFNKNEFELYNRGVVIEPISGCDCYYGNKCSRIKSCMNDISAESVYSTIKNIIVK